RAGWPAVRQIVSDCGVLDGEDAGGTAQQAPAFAVPSTAAESSCTAERKVAGDGTVAHGSGGANRIQETSAPAVAAVASDAAVAALGKVEQDGALRDRDAGLVAVGDRASAIGPVRAWAAGAAHGHVEQKRA